MAGIQNSEEALEKIYKVLVRGQDDLIDAQQAIIAAIHSVSNDWNDDKYVEVARMAHEMINGIPKLVIELGDMARFVTEIEKKLDASKRA